MELGQRIRQARLEQGLSQRQLCGEEITRNMLSQIENGSAKPSMDTLRYFATRLGKPVGWFLEEEAVISPNLEIMEKARSAWENGDYGQVAQLLEGYQAPDPVFDRERYLLGALSLIRQAATENRQVYAQRLLDQALQNGQKTSYFTPAMKREWVLQKARVQGGNTRELAKMLPEDDRELILRACAAMKGQEWKRAVCLLQATQRKNRHWHLLRGQCAVAMGEYSQAAEHLVLAETEFPAQCIPALEICYRELGDYKLAYHYACKHREL